MLLDWINLNLQPIKLGYSVLKKNQALLFNLMSDEVFSIFPTLVPYMYLLARNKL